jgi:hypothetical protein
MCKKKPGAPAATHHQWFFLMARGRAIATHLINSILTWYFPNK